MMTAASFSRHPWGTMLYSKGDDPRTGFHRSFLPNLSKSNYMPQLICKLLCLGSCWASGRREIYTDGVVCERWAKGEAACGALR